MIKQLFFTLAFLTIFNVSFSQDAYKIDGQVKGLSDTTCMLAYYYGDKQFAKDTADIDATSTHLTFVDITIKKVQAAIIG